MRHFRPAYDAMLQRATSPTLASHQFPHSYAASQEQLTCLLRRPSSCAVRAITLEANSPQCMYVHTVARRPGVCLAGKFLLRLLLVDQDPPNWRKPSKEMDLGRLAPNSTVGAFSAVSVVFTIMTLVLGLLLPRQEASSMTYQQQALSTQ